MPWCISNLHKLNFSKKFQWYDFGLVFKSKRFAQAVFNWLFGTMGWVSGLVLESLAFGQAFSLSCGVGWVFVLPVGLELLAFGFQVTVLGLGSRVLV